MTAKHFRQVATNLRLLSDEPDNFDATRIASGILADIFEAENPKFDRVRFFEACGFDDPASDPRCDICGRLEADGGAWNGDTGNHVACESLAASS